MVARVLLKITMLVLFCSAGSLLWAQPNLSVSPKASGGWNFILGKDNIPGGPGGNVTGDYESPADIESLTIGGCSGAADAWRIDIKKTDTLWDGDLVISARVRNTGTGDGTVSASGTYQVLTDTSTPFFSGKGNRADITVQLKVSGISVSRIQAGRYLADLLYTLTDTE
jgi:hypothetical protein